jgi:MFS family permease
LKWGILFGPIADIFGERIWLLIGGPAFAFMGFIAFFIPSIMNIEKEAEKFISGETTQKMV